MDMYDSKGPGGVVNISPVNEVDGHTVSIILPQDDHSDKSY